MYSYAIRQLNHHHQRSLACCPTTTAIQEVFGPYEEASIVTQAVKWNSRRKFTLNVGPPDDSI